MSDVAWPPPGGRDPWAGDPDQDAGPGPYADPDAEPHPEPGVPAPRGGGRRRTAAEPGAGRRARGRTPAPAAVPVLAPEPDAPATGRRRAGPAAPFDPAPAGPAPAGTGRRRGGLATVPAPAGPAVGTGPRTRRRGGAPAPRDTWRRLVPQALVVAFLAGGTTAFVAADKAVRLTVDGVPRTLHTFADDVDELLAAEGLGIGPHDLVAPAADEALGDGDEIVLRYGRPLSLTLDGQRREVWTTARTVDGALRQFGIRAEGAYLSTLRTAPVPRSGLTLAVRTERSITFMADGRERAIRTNAATVQEALDEAGITLHGQDTTSVPAGSFPRDGQTVTVLRITGTREIREERIPYRTDRVKDPALFAGTEVVERSGRPGARRVTYSMRTVNGVRQKPRRVAEETVREPVSQLVKIGTKPLPTSVRGADGLDWGALARCESGGRAGATDASGTYGGLYQFDVQTWQALGGSGRPQDAPGPEQTYRAKKLYVTRGASPWPHCGRTLYR
ncbi:ubiquitin-like domain-containing protein [Streptomyces sp. H27-H1]|uniref:ubiquitin-like domain-containing protein n=1 Tax=Streptomyces sp. H27-H1 TaxID=2996461 RepID=UPI002270F2E3|nr:ubiquitin-like domain-containing protein [Streptomyces sp. H27-H1]MCY0927270.1 ubiquitin-like domain-containing protein [Streptomyces sp. H27-H1]